MGFSGFVDLLELLEGRTVLGRDSVAVQFVQSSLDAGCVLRLCRDEEGRGGRQGSTGCFGMSSVAQECRCPTADDLGHFIYV